MMRLWNTDVCVASAASFVTHHESKDTRDVALEGEAHQVIGYGHVFIEGVWNSTRCARSFRYGCSASFHALELLFDFADVGEVFLENCIVGRAQLLPHLRRFLRDRIQ